MNLWTLPTANSHSSGVRHTLSLMRWTGKSNMIVVKRAWSTLCNPTTYDAPSSHSDWDTRLLFVLFGRQLKLWDRSPEGDQWSHKWCVSPAGFSDLFVLANLGEKYKSGLLKARSKSREWILLPNVFCSHFSVLTTQPPMSGNCPAASSTTSRGRYG